MVVRVWCTAPDHGLDDYIVGQKYQLEMAGLVANDGKFISTTPFFAGKGAFEANDFSGGKTERNRCIVKT